jgi:hypothetical protein
MLPDADSDYDETTSDAKKRTQPTHMKDMSLQPLCLYMEFLTRLLDARHVMDLRWFLSAIEVPQSNLLSKAGDGAGKKGKK